MATWPRPSLGMLAMLLLVAAAAQHAHAQPITTASLVGYFNSFLPITGPNAQFATNGSHVFISDAVDWQAEKYSSDVHAFRIARVPGNSVVRGSMTLVAGDKSRGNIFEGEGSPATSVSLGFVSSLATSPGFLYIATSVITLPGESYGTRIRRVNLATGIITTVAGNGSCLTGATYSPLRASFDASMNAKLVPLCTVTDLVFDPSRNFLFFIESGRVRVLEIATGRLRTYAGGFSGTGTDGAAAGAALEPTALAFSAGDPTNSLGNVPALWIGDRNCVRMVNWVGTISTVVGLRNQPPTSSDPKEYQGADARTTRIATPLSLAVDPVDGRALWIVGTYGRKRTISVVGFDGFRDALRNDPSYTTVKLTTLTTGLGTMPTGNLSVPLALARFAAGPVRIRAMRDQTANGPGAIIFWVVSTSEYIGRFGPVVDATFVHVGIVNMFGSLRALPN